MEEDYGFIIDAMKWSFSRLNSFYNCPYEWKRKYIDCEYKIKSKVSTKKKKT